MPIPQVLVLLGMFLLVNSMPFADPHRNNGDGSGFPGSRGGYNSFDGYLEGGFGSLGHVLTKPVGGLIHGSRGGFSGVFFG